MMLARFPGVIEKIHVFEVFFFENPGWSKQMVQSFWVIIQPGYIIPTGTIGHLFVIIWKGPDDEGLGKTRQHHDGCRQIHVQSLWALSFVHHEEFLHAVVPRDYVAILWKHFFFVGKGHSSRVRGIGHLFVTIGKYTGKWCRENTPKPRGIGPEFYPSNDNASFWRVFPSNPGLFPSQTNGIGSESCHTGRNLRFSPIAQILQNREKQGLENPIITLITLITLITSVTSVSWVCWRLGSSSKNKVWKTP